MIKLLEDELELCVREEDLDLTRSLIDECEEKFSEVMYESTKRDEFKCKLNVLEDRFLTKSNGGSCGGVIIYANNFRIVCSNTLEERLGLSFDQELP